MDDRDYIDTPEQTLPVNSQPEQPAECAPSFMPHTQFQEQLYRGDGVGRRESTYGDPLEEVTAQSEQAAQEHPSQFTAPTAQTPSEKKRSNRKLWPQLLICAGIGAAVSAIICAVALTSVKTQNELLIRSFEEKLSVAQQQLQSVIDNHIGTPTPEFSTPDTAVPDGKPPIQTLPGSSSVHMTPAQVYAQCVNSVVAINGSGNRSASSGSGFILSEDGYVATNYHVVEGQSKLEVSTYDGTTYQAKYIGGNEANDIALIKMDATGLSPVTVGTSSNLVVGEQVAAIGNPLGELASTLTVGYISAKDRIVATDGTQINMLQTDAAINPGNSGGPLFNMKGEVVGITSAKYSGTTYSGATIEGIGFAIPMDDVLEMLNDLREYGYITGGYLGVSVSDVDRDAAALYGLPVGVLVREVTSGSCAEKAGMKVQDIIVNVGGYDVGNLNDLSRALNKLDAGDTVTVTVYRSGKEQILSVTLDERPRELSDSSTNSQATLPTQPSPGGSIDDWFDYFLP